MKPSSLFLLLTLFALFSTGISFSTIYLKYFKQRAINIIDKAGPKDKCSRQLKAWIKDLFNLKKLWALQMFDASAKLQTGYLTGNVAHWGNYDQCLRINEDKGDDGIIEGQYCTVVLSPVKNVSSDISQFLDFTYFLPEVLGVKEGRELKNIISLFRALFGICLPKSCSADNLQKLWDYVQYTFRLPFRVTINENLCSYQGKVPNVFDFDKYVFCGFGIFFFILCLATVYDSLQLQLEDTESSLWKNIFTAFSLHKNLKSIFCQRLVSSDDTFSCLNGLKALSMLWIIFGHRYAYGFISGTINMVDYFEWKKSIVSLFVLLAPFAVDTFLTMSGLLLAYKYMEIRNTLPLNKPFPYFMFYFFRIIRLWPALIATIFLYTSVIKYINDGPVWPVFMYKFSLSCVNTGWLTALFMANIVKFNYQCVEPAWYLAVDTQLYCIAPLLLYFLYKYPKRTTLVLISICALSSFYAFVVTIKYKEKWIPSEGDANFHRRLYQSTLVRMPPWVVGLLTGTLIYNFQNINIPKVLQAFTWTYVLTTFFAIAKMTNYMSSTPYNEYYASIYNALVRQAWSLAICFLIFMCATGHGGIVNKLLSLKIYRVVVKLSYSIYLIHLAVIVLISGSKRTTAYHDSFTTLHAFFGDLPFIFAASLIWCVSFEMPFMNVAKILIQRQIGVPKAITEDNEKQLSKNIGKNKALVKNIWYTKQKNKKI